MTGKIDVLTRKDLRELAVVGSQLEVIDWKLYDTLTVATGGTQTSFRYFQQAIGQGGISLETTNMEIPGQLPAGYKFVCQEVLLVPKQALTLTAASVKDEFAVTHRGRAQFFIGTRPYLQVPLQDLIGGTFHGFAAAFDAATSIAYASPRAANNAKLEYSPVIPANYSFSMLVEYDTAPVLTASIPLQMQFVGKLIRPRQG